MSLESNLELNNKLLTQHNALLERLITALAPGVALRPDTVAQVQEYREPAEEKTKSTESVVGLDSLEFADVIALAGLYPVPVQHTSEMFQRVNDYRSAEGKERNEQIDALYMALNGVTGIKELSTFALLDLARHVLRHWDELPTFDTRQKFAKRLLDARTETWADIKPEADKQNSTTKERKGPFYWKDSGGAFGVADSMSELNILLEHEQTTEINKVEYLQLKEEVEKAKAEPADDTPDFAALRKQAEGLILQLAKGGYRAEAVSTLGKFGAKKLGEVADKDLAAVIAQAEKALSGD